MNLIKLIAILFMFVNIVLFNAIADQHEVEETNENQALIEKEEVAEKKEEINLDDEELPAIDPFQSSSAGVAGQSDGSQTNTQGQGIMSGLRLVGVIKGSEKKIAVLSSTEGVAYNYEEDTNINEDITLVEIFSDYLLIKDNEENFFEVHMNNMIKEAKE